MPGSRTEAAALTTLERAKRYIGIPQSSHAEDAFLNDLINAVSAWVKARAGTVPIRQESFAFSVGSEGLLRGNGTALLTLPYRPILSLTYMDPDVRDGSHWEWDGNSEEGGLTYGPAKNWTVNMRTGEIELHDGQLFPDGPFVRVEGIAGFADGSYTADAGFPFGGDIFTSALNGGKYHRLFGWETAAESLRNAVDELVAHTFRFKDRVKDNVASRSGDGINVTFLDTVPKEITQAIDQALPYDPIA